MSKLIMIAVVTLRVLSASGDTITLAWDYPDYECHTHFTLWVGGESGTALVDNIPPDFRSMTVKLSEPGEYVMSMTASDGDLRSDPSNNVTYTVYWPGDFDKDGDVDGVDLREFVRGYGR
jgi:hypothetical protein